MKIIPRLNRIGVKYAPRMYLHARAHVRKIFKRLAYAEIPRDTALLRGQIKTLCRSVARETRANNRPFFSSSSPSERDRLRLSDFYRRNFIRTPGASFWASAPTFTVKRRRRALCVLCIYIYIFFLFQSFIFNRGTWFYDNNRRLFAIGRSKFPRNFLPLNQRLLQK